MDVEVTILIPVYKPDLNTLGRLISALEKQTWKDFEVVLLNDGDVNFRPNENFSLPDDFVYKENSSNLGLYSSIRENLVLCSGSLVLILEQDVVPLNETFIERVMELHYRNPGAIISAKLGIQKNSILPAWIFYKRRIPNLISVDGRIDSNTNEPTHVNFLFNKADLIPRIFLESVLSTEVSQSNFGYDSLMSSAAISKGIEIITSDSIVCETGGSDQPKFRYFLSKEIGYGRSVRPYASHIGTKSMFSTPHFRERIGRFLFGGMFFSLVFASIVLFILAFVLTMEITLLILALVVLFHINSGIKGLMLRKTDSARSSRIITILKTSAIIFAMDISYFIGVVIGS